MYLRRSVELSAQKKNALMSVSGGFNTNEYGLFKGFSSIVYP